MIFKTLEEKYSETGQPSLLFLDEIDTLCADRSKSSTDWKRDQISTLLKLTNNASEKGIILIGATNMLDILDPAILRTGRFDKKIKIELPNTQERLEIIKNLTKERPIAHALLKDLPKIAQLTSGCTCSDINAILQTAMRRAIFEQKNSITLTDVTNAFETLELCTANLK